MANGYNNPTLIQFFALDKVSGMLTVIDVDEEDMGEHISVPLNAGLQFPLGMEEILNSDLVQKYHSKAKVFEINIVPVNEDIAKDLQKKTFHCQQLHCALNEALAPDPKNNRQVNLKEAERINHEIGVAQAEIINQVIAQPWFSSAGTSLTESAFERNPEQYIDYSSLSVPANISKCLSLKTPNLLFLAKSRLNPQKRYCAVKHWREILVNHFTKGNSDIGIKIPARTSDGFIVQMVVYMQSLVEDKDLQSEDNFALAGIDHQFIRLLSYFDTECLLNNVQIHLLSFHFGPKGFELLINVIPSF